MKRFLAIAMLLVSTSYGLTVGQVVISSRDTQLMSGSTKLLDIPKGTLLDVFKIDTKSHYWFQTEILAGEKTITGWVKIGDVRVLEKQCAKGFSYECQTSTTTECQSTNCKNECTSQQVWECNTTWECNTVWEYDPQTNEWGWVNKCDNVNKCDWATKEVCTPKCETECFEVPYETCGCKKK